MSTDSKLNSCSKSKKGQNSDDETDSALGGDCNIVERACAREVSDACSDSSLMESISPSPDSINDADNISRSSNNSDSVIGSSSSHSGSFKSSVSSGYDSCYSSNAPQSETQEPRDEPVCSKEKLITQKSSNSVSCANDTIDFNSKDDDDETTDPYDSLDEETPPPLPSSPPPNLPSANSSTTFPPFYIPPSHFPPPLFQNATNVTNATPMIVKLTKALSSSTPQLLGGEFSEGSNFSSCEELANIDYAAVKSLASTKNVSSSTPNLSPKLSHSKFSRTAKINKSMQMPSGRSAKRASVVNQIYDMPTAIERPKETKQPPKKFRNRTMSDPEENIYEKVPQVMHISGPTNVCLPASINLNSSMYKPIRSASAPPDKQRSSEHLAYLDPFLTEVSKSRDSSPFARFFPSFSNIAASKYDRTRSFMRRSLKSSTISSIRQSTRSLTSCALTTLRNSSRTLRTTLMSTLKRTCSLEDLDSTEYIRQSTDEMNISAPCIPKPVDTFAYCTPSSLESVKLRSINQRDSFVPIQKISTKKDKYNIRGNSRYNPPSDYSQYVLDGQSSSAALMSYREIKDGPSFDPDPNAKRGVVATGQHESYQSANESLTSSCESLSNVELETFSNSCIQNIPPLQTGDSGHKELYVFSESEISKITESISRSTTVPPTRPSLPKSPLKDLSSESPVAVSQLTDSSQFQPVSDSVEPEDSKNDSEYRETSFTKQVKKRFKAREQRKAQPKGDQDTIQTIGNRIEHSTNTISKKLKTLTKRSSKQIDATITDSTMQQLTNRPKGVNKGPKEEIYQNSFVNENMSKETSDKKDFSTTKSYVEDPIYKANLPIKRNQLAGLNVDERQIQLQQELVHCLKQRLVEYTTRRSLSPEPRERSLTPPPKNGLNTSAKVPHPPPPPIESNSRKHLTALESSSIPPPPPPPPSGASRLPNSENKGRSNSAPSKQAARPLPPTPEIQLPLSCSTTVITAADAPPPPPPKSAKTRLRQQKLENELHEKERLNGDNGYYDVLKPRGYSKKSDTTALFTSAKEIHNVGNPKDSETLRDTELQKDGTLETKLKASKRNKSNNKRQDYITSSNIAKGNSQEKECNIADILSLQESNKQKGNEHGDKGQLHSINSSFSPDNASHFTSDMYRTIKRRSFRKQDPTREKELQRKRESLQEERKLKLQNSLSKFLTDGEELNAGKSIGGINSNQAEFQKHKTVSHAVCDSKRNEQQKQLRDLLDKEQKRFSAEFEELEKHKLRLDEQQQELKLQKNEIISASPNLKGQQPSKNEDVKNDAEYTTRKISLKEEEKIKGNVPVNEIKKQFLQQIEQHKLRQQRTAVQKRQEDSRTLSKAKSSAKEVPPPLPDGNTSSALLPPPDHFCDTSDNAILDDDSNPSEEDLSDGNFSCDELENSRDDSEVMSSDHSVTTAYTPEAPQKKKKRVTFEENENEISYYPRYDSLEKQDITESKIKKGFSFNLGIIGKRQKAASSGNFIPPTCMSSKNNNTGFYNISDGVGQPVRHGVMPGVATNYYHASMDEDEALSYEDSLTSCTFDAATIASLLIPPPALYGEEAENDEAEGSDWETASDTSSPGASPLLIRKLAHQDSSEV